MLAVPRVKTLTKTCVAGKMTDRPMTIITVAVQGLLKRQWKSPSLQFLLCLRQTPFVSRMETSCTTDFTIPVDRYNLYYKSESRWFLFFLSLQYNRSRVFVIALATESSFIDMYLIMDRW